MAGNHDIGFHYATTPYLIKRFNEAFNISKTGVQRVSLKNIQFVLVNSMAMHGDQCSFCSKATKQLEKITQEFNCMENKEFCELEFVDEDVYSRPILLQHFPLYRESDINCGDEDGRFKYISIPNCHLIFLFDLIVLKIHLFFSFLRCPTRGREAKKFSTSLGLFV